MALWGITTADESKPKWLTDGNKVGDKQHCFADNRGWILRHYKNAAKTDFWDEVLVAIGGLSGAAALAEATISSVHFRDASYDQGDTGAVIVVYNELVDVTNGATLVVAGTTTGNITATASAQSETNLVVFTFTVPSQTEILSIGAQTISGTIVDTGTATASDKVIAVGDIIGRGGSGTVKTISVA